jgi:predicted O-methyltransferase YrrM
MSQLPCYTSVLGHPPRQISTRELIGAGPDVPVVPVWKLHTALGLSRPLDYPPASLAKPLTAWRMEDDDAPIFRYLYRELQPRRHLEFGTWQGTGALYCLEESAATVWTINLPFGESDGADAYSFHPEDESAVRAWAQRLGLPAQARYRTDTLGFIGRQYLERGWGGRVCQIYADSREWETSAYPAGFFDTVLIDGGHTSEVVANDTHKAFELVRPGGVVLWHDFCPPVYGARAFTRGVLESASRCWDWLTAHTARLFWIYPSWILLGVRNEAPLAAFPTIEPAAPEVCVRLGRMLQRPDPISGIELEQGVAALTALLSAPDIPAYLETAPRPFPPALLPLLSLNRDAALTDGNPLLAEVLEQIHNLIQAETAAA